MLRDTDHLHHDFSSARSILSQSLLRLSVVGASFRGSRPSASAGKALHCWFESVGHHITPSELIDLQHISSIADRINFGKVFPGRGI